MSNRIIVTSWVLLLLAIGLWGAVAYGAYTIVRVADERASDARQALTKANQSALNQRVEALSQSTQERRDQLTAMISTDLVTIISTIEEAGKSAGVQVKVSNASAGNSHTVPNGSPILGITFSVQAAGTYAQIMHAAQLYESLPLPSVVEYMEIERIQSADARSATWAMSLRVKVLTTAGVSI